MEPSRTPTSPPPSPARRTPTPTSPPVHLEIAAGTDRGRQRSGNEDSFLVASAGATVRSLPQGERLELSALGWVALGVCDGMGGAAAGEIASSAAVDVIREVLSGGGATMGREALGRRLVAGVEEASRRLHAASLASPSLSGMGTTATVCALQGDVLFIAQVGDSRAYLLRDGRLAQLTRDQTLAALLIERGQLSPEDLPDFQLGHIILQAVGTSDHIEVDLKQIRVRRGDVLLVCSDGLYGAVPDDTLRDVLLLEPSPLAAVETLVALANEAGGPDNITAIVARLGGAALWPPDAPVTPEPEALG